ncbi:oligosaccharide repeat unit polymerase [Leisingera thetidis]|uniref:oligosaccharide repeat unit polymerase n=1 Tax=Leisingera thetidis TaxID=2930199 RepID=UPI0021F7739C|nr:oligosaccharide repeat unit polymerase [Leisingera thetidis]
MTHCTLRIISPVSLVVLIWAVTLVIGLLPLAFPDSMELALYFIRRQNALSGGIAEAITPLASLWLLLMLLVFVLGSKLAAVSLPARPRAFDLRTDFDQAARATFAINLAIVAIVLLWVLLTARQLGGFRALVIMVQLDVLEAREQLLGNKLFTGMRLLYGALPSTGTLAAALLAANSRAGGMSRTARRLCLFTLMLDLALLTVLPIVMSQRLLLVLLIMGAYFSACMVHRRLVGVQYIPLGIGLFLTTWTLREALSNASIDASATAIGLQKLVFYFTNDLMNSFLPLNQGPESEHSYGYFSFRFLLFFTQTDGFFQNLLADKLERINTVRGGGTWSIFVMPYVDFGAVGAAVYVAALGALSRFVFHKGAESVFWAAAYSHFAAAFALSTHTTYFANANFTAILLFTWLIAGWTKRKPSPQAPRRGSHFKFSQPGS